MTTNATSGVETRRTIQQVREVISKKGSGLRAQGSGIEAPGVRLRE